MLLWDDEQYMRAALLLAEAAADQGEVPVGAVVVHDGQIIGSGYNQREAGKDATRHAEMDAIRAACAALGGWRLPDSCLYVTLEPCPMCAGAILSARIPRVVFGATDPISGACGSKLDVLSCGALNHKTEVIAGVLAEECAARLKAFFAARRKG